MLAAHAAAGRASAEAAVSGPWRASVAGRPGDQGRQFGPVGHGERDVCAAAAAGWPALGPRCEAPVREEPDVERGQREFLTMPGTGPAESPGDRDVDRQGGHVGGAVAAHGPHILTPAGTG